MGMRCSKQGIQLTLLFIFLNMVGYCQPVPTAACNTNANAEIIPTRDGYVFSAAFNTTTAFSAPAGVGCSSTGFQTGGWLWFTAVANSTTITDTSVRDIGLWIYNDNGTPCTGQSEINCTNAFLTNGAPEVVTVTTVYGNKYYIKLGRNFGAVASFSSQIATWCKSSKNFFF